MKTLRALRKERNLTMKELGAIIGVSESAVSQYETGKREPDYKLLESLSDFFDVSTDYLIGRTDANASSTAAVVTTIPGAFVPQFKKIPLVGSIACGQPIFAEENIEGYVDCEANVNASFALRCKGDSMVNARINDGDLVFIHEQPKVETGEIAAVLIGEEATLKRVYINSDNITLLAENPKYAPLVYANETMNSIKILGKAVAFLSYL